MGVGVIDTGLGYSRARTMMGEHTRERDAHPGDGAREPAAPHPRRRAPAAVAGRRRGPDAGGPAAARHQVRRRRRTAGQLVALGLGILRKKRADLWRKAARRGEASARGRRRPAPGPRRARARHRRRRPRAAAPLRRGGGAARRPVPRDPAAQARGPQLRGDRGGARSPGEHRLQLGLPLPPAPAEAAGRPLGLRGRERRGDDRRREAAGSAATPPTRSPRRSDRSCCERPSTTRSSSTPSSRRKACASCWPTPRPASRSWPRSSGRAGGSGCAPGSAAPRRSPIS